MSHTFIDIQFKFFPGRLFTFKVFTMDTVGQIYECTVCTIELYRRMCVYVSVCVCVMCLVILNVRYIIRLWMWRMKGCVRTNASRHTHTRTYTPFWTKKWMGIGRAVQSWALAVVQFFLLNEKCHFCIFYQVNFPWGWAILIGLA